LRFINIPAKQKPRESPKQTRIEKTRQEDITTGVEKKEMPLLVDTVSLTRKRGGVLSSGATEAKTSRVLGKLGSQRGLPEKVEGGISEQWFRVVLGPSRWG